ncbi:DUF5946 family protein [Sphingomonas sp. KR3-1]|uniref:DUF5946 family protein n=1 Tax=Sphingomonas sp. KR3-1 TaxID=3156611 RepID=UPI0032B418B6
MSETACCGCGGRFPDIAGPTHPYMLSSPGCWAAYGEVLAREYADPALFAACHRLTVDAYAIQHPGNADDPRAVRSVWLHFAALHAVFAHGYALDAATGLLQRLAGQDFPALPGPAPIWEVTLADLNAADHAAEMRRWAEGAYRGWRPLLAEAVERMIA